MTERSFRPRDSFIRVAAACPEVTVGDVATNTQRIIGLSDDAARRNVSVVAFPELSLTGYTLGDMVQQRQLLQNALEGLIRIAGYTDGGNTTLVVGFPLAVGNAIYNCAAVVSGGVIRGIVPKTHLPAYKEFYEKRWFQTWSGKKNIEIAIGDQAVPFGTDMLFRVGAATMGIEICEDLWVRQPPSGRLAEAGATLIVNPSASPEQIGKSTYRRQLVAQQSGRLVGVYVYAGCDATESTTDIVMSGHQIIAENGQIVAERSPLAADQRLIIADIDIEHLLNDRRRDTNFMNEHLPLIDCGSMPMQSDLLRTVEPHPFVPHVSERDTVLQTAFDIQAQALATRMRDSGIYKVVLGLSGGLDSTLALLAAVQAATRLGLRPQDVIQTLTMPGGASTKRTQNNAQLLAQKLGIPNEVLPIAALAQRQLQVIGHDGKTQDITYENVQARIRTSILFNRANQQAAMVLGTGDLSEIALGWCTFNGDHMSHYNVNASIPKTLVRHLAAYASRRPAIAVARQVLEDILDTPVSPELTRSGPEGITQETEEIIGPYELHDFFLYQLLRWNDPPQKIAYLAKQAFAGTYRPETIDRWLNVFLTRFTHAQWKRSVATDGPKVGSVSLSPRGDWRMPSTMSPAIWDRLQ